MSRVASVLRPLSLLPALVVAASLLGAPAGLAVAAPHGSPKHAAPKQAAPKQEDISPLAVTIDSLSSSEIPQRGPIRVTGSVTNHDDGPWSDVNVYAFIGSTPITTSADLATAAAMPMTADVGERIIDVGDPQTQDTIDELAPGGTAQFAVTVPHRYLEKTEAGVYWFGVHALGGGPEGRVDGADGRARTFLPYVGRTSRSVDTALVIPVRRLVTHAADGSLAALDRWDEELAPGGSLHSLVELGNAAGSRPVSWLVDPSVIDAAQRLAAGNPPRSLGPTVDPVDTGDTGDGDGDGEEGSPSAEPSPSPSAEPDEEPTPAEAALAATATTWLDRLHAGLEGSEILSLPYGDVDVAGAAASDPSTYRQARRRSAELAPWDLPARPAVSSPLGYLDPAGIRLTDSDDTVLITDRMLGARAPAVVNTVGRTVGVTSSGAVSGGPDPVGRMSPLAVRQRIVSEAALRLLSPARKPLIAVFSSTWRPDATVAFWAGLDLPWLTLTTVQTAMARSGTDVPVERLAYPESQQALTLDATSFLAADDLAQAGETLQNLLTQNESVATEVRDESFTDVSYSSRLRASATRASTDQSRAWIETRLGSVHLDAPKAVILSSGSGRFSATVTNDLDQPVSVRIRAVTDPPLRVAVPNDSVDLGPDSRTTVLLNASSSAVGIRNVTLLLTDVDGSPLGSSDTVPVRSNRVSNVIWLILGTGVALLFGAIVVRLVRRVVAARRAA